MNSTRRSQSGLTALQVVFLFVLFAGASVVIFLFGIWVGRDATERRLLREERMVRVPIAVSTPSPARAEERPEEAVDRAFYERLRQKAAERLALAPPTVSPAATAAAEWTVPPRVLVTPGGMTW